MVYGRPGLGEGARGRGRAPEGVGVFQPNWVICWLVLGFWVRCLVIGWGRRPRCSASARFPGIVTRVVKDRVAAQVEIQAGPYRLVSLITRDAADELDLKPGMPAVAVVKATNVHVELPRE